MDKGGDIFLGQSQLSLNNKEVTGEFVELEGELFYLISNYDKMPPFFMSVVSNSDHWMFISSTGGLTCGRKDPSNALFPYYTDDKIHDSADTTGPKSIFLIEKQGRKFLWEPFCIKIPGVYDIRRNLFKNTLGNKITFEEVNLSLKVKFQYSWLNSDKYGFVKHSCIVNMDRDSNLNIELLDGLQNILPYGVNINLQTNMSTLVDGYKKCELDEKNGLGIYTLSSILTDRAEPSEALKATTTWSAGMENPRYFLSSGQLQNFKRGIQPNTETSLKGIRGGYFINGDFILKPEEKRDWLIIADVSQGPSDVPATIHLMESGINLREEILKDVERGKKDLIKLVSMADGNQSTADDLINTRHFSNTLFNIMRGGIFPENYQVNILDFRVFISQWNPLVYNKHKDYLENLTSPLIYQDLSLQVQNMGDPDLIRITLEYLPLTFSRRHGDPSRPWNMFFIDLKNEDGSQKFFYQGNWRDIFQNWEALALSYPGFIESFIARFVNASTVDGYNPYRITRDGIDWEIHNPEDPWSNIGYWGDHQIIYLLKFLELSSNYHPGKLEKLLESNLFTYANLPYRIKSYQELIEDPHNSIVYDPEEEKLISERVSRMGSDGKLVFNSAGEVLKVNLTEKLLVPLLSKLSNFVPEGGIWMNTQRPEWNDANNALAGNGLSMVTLYYLRRYITTISRLFSTMEKSIPVSSELGVLFQGVYNIFSSKKPILSGRFSDAERREIVDSLGQAGSRYRRILYEKAFSERRIDLTSGEINRFLGLSLEFIDHTIETNRRDDFLFHSYNLVEFGKDTCSVRHLYLMLEGQVAVLSSGFLDAERSLLLLDALRSSKMYRKDQNSYTLYPDRELPGFLEKNIIAKDQVDLSQYLQDELKNGGNQIIEVDINGEYHFNGSLRNEDDLLKELDDIANISHEEKDIICNVFIDCFKHKEFTGRSGSFFKYEGLGSIYWHMVSKLLLEVQQIYLQSLDHEINAGVLARLKEHYQQIREGLGLRKSPDEYGAFPTDPYSHTPGFAGVQQPGMTGQVKEDFLSRLGELGVSVSSGCLSFNPRLISPDEFLESERDWYIDGRVIKLGKGELGFSVCGTPVVYKRGSQKTLIIELEDGRNIKSKNTILIDEKLSKLIFNREGTIKCIRAMVVTEPSKLFSKQQKDLT